MTTNDEIVTVSEVAKDLRCSKALIYRLIGGDVRGVPPLPAIRLGRRRLIRRSALEEWKRVSEGIDSGGMIPPSPEVDAAGRTKGALHA